MTARQMKDRYLVPAVIALVFGAGAGWTRQQLHDASQDQTIESIRTDINTRFTRLDRKLDSLDARQRQMFCLTIPKPYREGCQ